MNNNMYVYISNFQQERDAKWPILDYTKRYRGQTLRWILGIPFSEDESFSLFPFTAQKKGKQSGKGKHRAAGNTAGTPSSPFAKDALTVLRGISHWRAPPAFLAKVES